MKDNVKAKDQATQHRTRCRFRAIALVFFTSTAVTFEPIAVAAESADRCISKIPEKWSKVEQFIWTKICTGSTADLDSAEGFGDTLKADKEEGWASSGREVRPGFIQDILAEKRYTDDIPLRRVSIKGAFFPRYVGMSAINVNYLEFLNCRFEDHLSLHFLNVENELSIRNSTIKYLQLYVTTVRTFDIVDSEIYSIEIRRSTIKDYMLFQGIKSDSILLIGGGAKLVEILGPQNISNLELQGYKIEDNLSFFNGKSGLMGLTLLQSKIDGSLYFSPSEADSPRRSFTAVLTSVGDFYEPVKSPTKVDLRGFDFKRWVLRSSDQGADNALRLLSSTEYNPNLYLKLAQSLKSDGNYRAMRDVLFAKRSRDYNISNQVDKGLNWISWGLVGYGLRPEIGLIWFALLFAAGYFAFRSGEGYVPAALVPRSWLIFTADTIIPLLSIDKAHATVSFPGWRQWLLYFLKISGILLVYLVFKILEQSITPVN
jgi:hypothetical protein